jgi:hypothetical protein
MEAERTMRIGRAAGGGGDESVGFAVMVVGVAFTTLEFDTSMGVCARFKSKRNDVGIGMEFQVGPTGVR